MKIKPLENWDKKLFAGVVRFPVSVIIVVVYAVLTTWSLHHQAYKIGHNFIAFFITGFFLSIAVALAVEEFRKRWLVQLAALITSGLWLVYWTFQPATFDADYLYYLSAMVLITFILALFSGSFIRTKKDISFWNFTAATFVRAIITIIFSGVLMGGISLAFKAIDILFKAHVHNNTYGYIAICCFILFGPVYFLSNIPPVAEKHDIKIRFNKFLKIFSIYIIIPILLIYTIILYAYLIKITIDWQLPNGWVSWLVSILGVGGSIAVMLLHPVYTEKKNKAAELFCRYFPVAVLPLLVLMTIGIFRRFNDYGLTINRLLVIILNIWMYAISIYFIVTRSEKIKMVLISFAVITFIAAVGPWSVFNTTRKSVYSHLQTTFAQHHLLAQGKISALSLETLQKDSSAERHVSSALLYMHNTFGYKSLQPIFQDTLSPNSIFKIVNDMTYPAEDTDIETEIVSEPEAFPAGGFQSAIPVEIEHKTTTLSGFALNGNTLTFRNHQPEIDIPLTNCVAQWKARSDSGAPLTTNKTIINGKNYKLIIYKIRLIKGNPFTVTRISGLLFF
jgi:hypothetical protein